MRYWFNLILDITCKTSCTTLFCSLSFHIFSSENLPHIGRTISCGPAIGQISQLWVDICDLLFFFPFSGMGINCWENANGSRHLTKEVRKKETTQQKASIWGNIHFISAAAESCPASAWKRERVGYSHSNAVLSQKPSSPLAQLVLLWAPQWGVGWVDSLPKPWLANFRVQTCPVPSVLALADGNNADSTSMALSQELYHSVLFNRKCMSFFICLLASKLLELLTLFASFLFNFKNKTFPWKTILDNKAKSLGSRKLEL